MNGEWQVTLYNPYGRDVSKDVERTLDQSNPKDDGFITNSWSQFVGGLQVVVTAKKR